VNMKLLTVLDQLGAFVERKFLTLTY